MPRHAEQLLHEALELSVEERAALADSLLESLDAEIDEGADQAWRDEVQRRMASLDEGSAKLVPWDELYSRLNRRLQH